MQKVRLSRRGWNPVVASGSSSCMHHAFTVLVEQPERGVQRSACSMEVALKALGSLM
jgi:hypothetical protein